MVLTHYWLSTFQKVILILRKLSYGPKKYDSVFQHLYKRSKCSNQIMNRLMLVFVLEQNIHICSYTELGIKIINETRIKKLFVEHLVILNKIY